MARKSKDMIKKQMDGRLVGWIEKIYEKIDGWLDGQQKKLDETIDGWMDRKDKWMVGCIVKKI